MTNHKQLPIEATIERLEKRIEKMKINQNYHRIEQGSEIEYTKEYDIMQDKIDLAYDLIDFLFEQKDKVGKLNNLLIHSDGHSLTIFEPNLDLIPIIWENVSKDFQSQFFSKWKEAYEAEKTSGNAGIDIISLLDSMAIKINSGKYTINDNFDRMYAFQIEAYKNQQFC